MMEQRPCMTLGKTAQQSLRHFVAYVGIINFMYEIFHHVGSFFCINFITTIRQELVQPYKKQEASQHDIYGQLLK